MPGLHRCPQGVPPAPRLAFLDGLRGLAALYVVLHHAALMVPPAGLAGPAVLARSLLRHGHSAVAVFIVLSGYCLMLPATLFLAHRPRLLGFATGVSLVGTASPIARGLGCHMFLALGLFAVVAHDLRRLTAGDSRFDDHCSPSEV